LNDAGDTSDEEEELVPAYLSAEGIDAISVPDSEPTHPGTQQERERLEWQALLTSVLSGDVLKSEKTRIAVALNSLGDEQANYNVNLWLGIRAKFHGRSVEEERKKLDERRLRTVDGTINEILNFRVSETQPGANTTAAAFEEVTTVLRQLEVIQSLYPSLKAFYLDKPLAAEPAFQSRCDTLNTWYTVHTTLKHHFALLRRWTGSNTLDVNQPYTNHETNPSSGGGDMADGTTFVERLLKEESMQLTFEKGFLVTVHNFLGAARDAQVNLASLFKEMNLPTFEKELVPLISFPTRLAQAGLRLRLDYVQKLKEPDIMIIDQMTEDLKLSIGLACTLKRQYQAILAPDPGGNWNLPQCINEDYDRTILEALTDFFKIIHWKLKNGSKAILFKETDVLENQWGTFNDVSITTAGGSSLVAEQLWCVLIFFQVIVSEIKSLSSLTNKLMVRVTNYFETQVRVPMGHQTAEHLQPTQLRNDLEFNLSNLTPTSHNPEPSRKMTDAQIVSWYSKILESVRLRYRKLQRFAR
jgi:mitogen-activated protein kinase kinase kinase